MAEHLASNGIDISHPTLTLGPWLEMNGQTETFLNNPKANALLTREYRKGFEVPNAQTHLTQTIYDPVPRSGNAKP